MHIEMTVRERCEQMGLKAYDTSLPQPWVDMMRDRHGVDVLGKVVWSYDEAGVFGRPVGLTPEGVAMVELDKPGEGVMPLTVAAVETIDDYGDDPFADLC